MTYENNISVADNIEDSAAKDDSVSATHALLADLDQKLDLTSAKSENNAVDPASKSTLPSLQLEISEQSQGHGHGQVQEQELLKPESALSFGQGQNGADQQRKRMRGVNLCGAEFGADSLPGQVGRDYIFPTSQELDYYKQKGLDLIRMPFLWERMQPGLLNKNSQNATVDRSFDPGYQRELDKFLSDADQRGMEVVLDAQQFGRFNKQIIGASNITNDDFKAFWGRMAKTFGHHPSIYGYDLSNEPHDQDNKTWYAAAQAAVDGIRESGDKNIIFVEGNNWAGTQSWTNSNDDIAINDPANNLVYEAHSYWDKDHSGTYAGGVKSSYEQAVDQARKSGFLAAGEDPSQMGVNYAKPFVEWLKKHNARGYIGEYGVPSNDPDWVKVQDKFLAYARANNLDTTAWAGGPWWGKDATLTLETGPKGESSTTGPEPLSLKSIAADGKNSADPVNETQPPTKPADSSVPPAVSSQASKHIYDTPFGMQANAGFQENSGSGVQRLDEILKKLGLAS